jgi:ribose transport system permease protein
MNIVLQATVLMMVSLGQAFVIIGGNLDFSVGGIVSVTTCIIATQMKDPLTSIFAISAFALLVGCLVGLLNGTGIAFFNINPFIMTLGTMSILQGVSFFLREYAGGYVPKIFISGMTGKIGFIPVPILLIVVVSAIGFLVLKRTRFGRYIYALGGDEENARTTGINTNLIKIGTYVVSGFLSALGGLFMAARIASGDPNIGQSFPLDSITSVVLGGVIIGGGRGNLLGVIGGVFFVVILSNVLTLFDVSPYYQYIIKGLILIVAVAITFRKEIQEYV